MTIQTEQRATTWTIEFEDLGAIAAGDTLYFTIKKRTTDADADALVKIERTIGLQVIAGDVAGTPGNGGINVTDIVDGDLAVTLQPVESAKLASRPNAFYDIKLVTVAGVVSVLRADRFNITSVTTEAVA